MRLQAGYSSGLSFPNQLWESCSLLLSIFLNFFFLVSPVYPSLESKGQLGISVMNSVLGLCVILQVLDAFEISSVSCTM